MFYDVNQNHVCNSNSMLPQLLPIKQPGSEYFIGFVISVAFAGVFGGLFVLLLMVVIVVTCCYYCRRDSD